MFTPTDAALQVGTGEFLEFFLSCTPAGLAPGSQGWWDDNCMLRPWGFDLANIAVPVLLLHGGQDLLLAARPRRMAGPAHSRRRGSGARR